MLSNFIYYLSLNFSLLAILIIAVVLVIRSLGKRPRRNGFSLTLLITLAFCILGINLSDNLILMAILLLSGASMVMCYILMSQDFTLADFLSEVEKSILKHQKTITQIHDIRLMHEIALSEGNYALLTTLLSNRQSEIIRLSVFEDIKAPERMMIVRFRDQDHHEFHALFIESAFSARKPVPEGIWPA